jgi:hypothetical protein
MIISLVDTWNCFLALNERYVLYVAEEVIKLKHRKNSLEVSTAADLIVYIHESSQ